MRVKKIFISIITIFFVFGCSYLCFGHNDLKVSAKQTSLNVAIENENSERNNQEGIKTTEQNSNEATVKSDNFYSSETVNSVANSISKVPLEEKIAQMLVIGYDISSPFAIENIKSAVKNKKISGIMFYKKQINSPAGIKSKIDTFNKLSSSPYPLFMMIDQEGGRVSRIAKDNGFKLYPSAQYVAKYYTLNQAYKIYYEMASDLKEVGINFNLAPCVDVKTNPKSQIASDFRIYSSNPETVYEYSNEFVKAHNEAKVAVALKHFPGLGSGVADSHKTLPDITNTWKEEELIPYKKLVEEFPKVPILVGHALNKNLDKDNMSSLSQKTIDVLSDDMSHKGVVMTDAIDMSAIHQHSIEDILVTAINSGVNLFIFPNHVYNENDLKTCMNPDVFIKIVKDAVSSGKIEQTKIDESFKKITDLKRRISN